jgi:hypothetical protein
MDIIDRAGGIVRSTTAETLAGTQQIVLSLEGLQPGWYLCRIARDGTFAYRTLLVD